MSYQYEPYSGKLRFQNPWTYLGREEVVKTTDLPQVEDKTKVSTGQEQFWAGNAPTSHTLYVYKVPVNTSFPALIPAPHKNDYTAMTGGMDYDLRNTSLADGQSVKADYSFTLRTPPQCELYGTFDITVDFSELLPVSSIVSHYVSSTESNVRTVTFSLLGLFAKLVDKYTQLFVTINFRVNCETTTDFTLSFDSTLTVRGWLVDQLFYKTPKPPILCNCCDTQVSKYRVELDCLDSFVHGKGSGSCDSVHDSDPSEDGDPSDSPSPCSFELVPHHRAGQL